MPKRQWNSKALAERRRRVFNFYVAGFTQEEIVAGVLLGTTVLSGGISLVPDCLGNRRVCGRLAVVGRTAVAQYGLGNGERAAGPVFFREKNGHGEIDPSTTKNIQWVAKLGNQTFGSPVVSGDKVFIGTAGDSSSDAAFLRERLTTTPLSIKITVVGRPPRGSGRCDTLRTPPTIPR